MSSSPLVNILGVACAAAVAGVLVLPMVKVLPGLSMSSEPQSNPQRQKSEVAGTKPANTWAEAQKKGHEIVSFGTGCFWCSEDDFRRTKGVVATEVGFQGGHVENPTYKRVCEHDTGHVEVTRLEYDPKVVSFKSLAERFFEIHDPTQGNRQGPDEGEQYRSVIFVYSAGQKATAKAVLASAQKKLTSKITTTIEDAPVFWRAEDYHQQYYQKLGHHRDN